MRNIIVFLVLSIATAQAFASGASVGVPYRIYYNVDGYTYVLLESGNNEVDCLFGSSKGSHRMPKSDPDYDTKLSLIMMAFAAGKTVHLQDGSPNGSNQFCDIDLITVSN